MPGSAGRERSGLDAKPRNGHQTRVERCFDRERMGRRRTSVVLTVCFDRAVPLRYRTGVILAGSRECGLFAFCVDREKTPELKAAKKGMEKDEFRRNGPA